MACYRRSHGVRPTIIVRLPARCLPCAQRNETKGGPSRPSRNRSCSGGRTWRASDELRSESFAPRCYHRRCVPYLPVKLHPTRALTASGDRTHFGPERVIRLVLPPLRGRRARSTTSPQISGFPIVGQQDVIGSGQASDAFGKNRVLVRAVPEVLPSDGLNDSQRFLHIPLNLRCSSATTLSRRRTSSSSSRPSTEAPEVRSAAFQDERRASRTMLNGPVTALLTWSKPPERITSVSFASPACAPNPSPTS